MKFSDHQTAWLYGENGYYTTYHEIGKKGDFYTAVSTSKFFGGSIAMRIIATIDEGYLPSDAMIVEVGAHKGYLLADIIEFINTLRPELLSTLSFAIVERFDALQAVQKSYFTESFGDAITLHHYHDLSSITQPNVAVVANEIFDAFPTEIIANNQMLYIEDHKLVWAEMDERTAILAQKYAITKGEVPLGFGEFATALARFEKCEFITFDYGDKYARNDISARVYKAHETFPLFEEGLDLSAMYQQADITYDVNFEMLIGEFEASKMKLEEFAFQNSALIRFGIGELLETLHEKVDFKIYKQESDKIKILLAPNMMGDRFKMTRFRK